MMRPYLLLPLSVAVICLAALGLPLPGAQAASPEATITVSSVQSGTAGEHAIDGDRFSTNQAALWMGARSATNWTWQIQWREARRIGSILQIQGTHDFVFTNAPLAYAWQFPTERGWADLPNCRITNESRVFRIHRLPAAVRVKTLRLSITSAAGIAPALREIEFLPEPASDFRMPPWILVVNTTHDGSLPNHGQEFIPLARKARGFHEIQAQQIWLDQFNLQFIAAEPRPLAAFLSGNFKDWCEVDRTLWTGAQAILKQNALPIWASCGGAQGLAIVSEHGVENPWDCPHCRDPRQPRTPIYNHIGHVGQRPCGDYSKCIFEKGPYLVRKMKEDPAFEGLPLAFTVIESHCGQIEWTPAGWEWIIGPGDQSKTKIQCLKKIGAPIYAAQFHIEMEGSPDASRQIMENFLRSAAGWR